MALVARHREPQRAGLHTVAHEPLHLLYLVIGGGALLAVVAHHVVADGGMADQIADVDAEMVIHLVEVLWEGLPSEFEGVEDLHRDRLDIGEELRQAPLRSLAHWRQRERAIAEDHRRGAVVAGERAQRVPSNLSIVMAVVIDEPGCDDPALGIDRPLGGPAQFADLGDLAVLDRDIAAERRHSRAVDDAAVTDQEIIRHGYLPFVRWFVEA